MKISGILIVVALVIIASISVIGIIKYERIEKINAIALVLITTSYAIFTLFSWMEARKTSEIMKETLKFSNMANINFFSIITDNPNISSNIEITDEYKNAKKNYESSPTDNEFVFAVIKNTGRGVAEDISLKAKYCIEELNKGPREVTREIVLNILEPQISYAVLINCYNSIVPNDSIKFISAQIEYSDLYKKANREKPSLKTITPSHGAFIEGFPDHKVRILVVRP